MVSTGSSSNLGPKGVACAWRLLDCAASAVRGAAGDEAAPRREESAHASPLPLRHHMGTTGLDLAEHFLIRRIDTIALSESLLWNSMKLASALLRQAPPGSRFRLSVCAFTRAAVDIGLSEEASGGAPNLIIVAESLRAFALALSLLHADDGRVSGYLYGTLRWDVTLAAVAPLTPTDEALCEAFLSASTLLARPGFYDARFRGAVLLGGGGATAGAAVGETFGRNPRINHLAAALRQHREGM